VDPVGPGFEWGKKRIAKAMRQHEGRCARYRRREEAWLATQKPREAPKVRFAYQRMDVLLSYITAEKPVGRVAPLKPGAKCEAAAKLMDKAINEWRRQDDRAETLESWILQALVYGVAPAKVVWAYERAEETFRKPVIDPYSGEMTGVEWETREVTPADRPSMARINSYDFAWDPGATRTDLKDAEFVCYWAYPTVAQVKQGQKEGRYHNTEDIDAYPSAGPDTGNSARRNADGRDLTGRVKLCEVWSRDRLVVIANDAICIRDEPNPYTDMELPFVLCTTQPDMIGIESTSEVELVAAIQRELWEIRREWMINLKQANKLIVLVDGEVGNLDQYLNALRGEDQFIAIPVDTNNGVPPVTWNPTASLVGFGAEGTTALKTEMDDMSGVGAYVSGQLEKAVDPKTATEVSTLQSAAMRRINKTRNNINRAIERVSNRELARVAQFMIRPLAIRVDEGNAWAWDYVDPQGVIDSELEYVIRDADESLDQQQKRTEASNRFATALAAFPVMQAAGQGVPNLEKEYENLLEAYGEEDAKEWIIPPAPPMLPPVLGAPPPSGSPTGVGGGGPSPSGAPTPIGPAPAAPNPGGYQ
jgi:hypothetical protein